MNDTTVNSVVPVIAGTGVFTWFREPQTEGATP